MKVVSNLVFRQNVCSPVEIFVSIDNLKIYGCFPPTGRDEKYL